MQPRGTRSLSRPSRGSLEGRGWLLGDGAWRTPFLCGSGGGDVPVLVVDWGTAAFVFALLPAAAAASDWRVSFLPTAFGKTVDLAVI